MKKLIYILTLSFATLMYTAAQDPEPVATEENSPAYAEESTREGRAMDADAAEAAGVSEIVVAGGNEGVAMMAAQSVDAGQITGNETITSGTTPSKITSYLLPNCMYSYTISWEYATALIGGQYDWRTVSGATGLDYQPGALTSTTYYRRVLNYNDGSQKQLYTNIVTKTVTATPTLNPGTISGTQIVNYPAAPLTLTNVTSPSSSAGSYTIFWEWKEDLGSWQSVGATGLSYQPGVLTKKTYFRRGVKITSGTLTAYSNEVTVTINFGSLSAGTIGYDQVKDKNTRPDEIKGINPITGTAGVPFSYWWEKSTTSASGPWTTVSGIGSSASGASVYGNNYHPPILSQTTWYRRVAWRDLDEYTTYSNVVKIRIPLNAGLLQKSNVTGDDSYYAEHPNFTAILNDIEPYSGEGAFSVFWESSQSKNGPWTIIPGATGNNYTPSGILKATTYYRRGVKLNSDASNVQYSNIITYRYYYGYMSGGSITPEKQQIQEFMPTKILQSKTDPVTIVNGKYSVQWQKASDNGVWSDIPGATDLTYNPGKVYSTTNFRRVADIKLNDVTINIIYSNTVSVEVFSAAEWIALSNYITKRVPLVASADASALSTSQCMWTIQYMDGLGRPMQTIQKGFSPEGKDIVTLQEYDAAGRESKTWLPVPKNYGLGADNTGAYVPAADIKSFATAYYSNDAYPYTEPVYEASPLQKVTHQYGPGEAWRSADRPVRTNTSTNADGTETGTALAYLKCYRYSVTTTGIQNHGLYPKGRLTVTKTTDEDNQIYYEFKDNRDRVILQRRISSASEYLDTYYVYDDRGLLRYVLPPGASANLTSQTSWDNNNTYIAQFAYTYKYDGRGQCIEKKLPGADPIYYVYDKTDHLIASQDGVQRATGLWSYTIPDKYGRTVIAGTCTKLNNLTLAPGVLNAIEVTAEYNGTNTAYMGYTPSVEITTSTLLAVNYYDIYDFLSGSATKTTFSGVTYDTSLETYGKRNDATRHHGMLTGSIAMQVDPPVNRNLLLNSGVPVSNSSYPTTYYLLSEPLIEGQQYTVQIKGVLGDGKTDFRLYNSPGAGVDMLVSLTPSTRVNGVYTATFLGKASREGTDKVLLYPIANTVTSVSSVEWIKLEKGPRATPWSPAPEDVISPGDVVGRNLLLNSGVPVQNNAYNIANYVFSEPLIDGQQYTVQIKGALGEGKLYFGLFNSTTIGADQVTSLPPSSCVNGIYTATFTGKAGSGPNTHIRIYTVLGTVTTTSSIEWIKLEKGTRATPWIPAPEDAGGHNLCPNTDVNRNGILSSWLPWPASAFSNMSHTVGNFIRRVRSTGSSVSYGIQSPLISGGLKSGQQYTVSMEISNRYNTTNLNYNYIMSPSLGNKRLDNTFTIPSPTGDFHRVFFTFTADKDYPDARILIGSETGNDAYSDQGFAIRNFKVEKGAQATSWSPAPQEPHGDGRNLLLNSGVPVQNNAYNMTNYTFSEPLISGQQYTVQIKGKLGDGKSYFGLFNSTGVGADQLVSLPPSSCVNGIYTATFTGKPGSGSNTHVIIYTVLNTVTTTSSIEWIKLEKGTRATPWCPAPEDGMATKVSSVFFYDNRNRLVQTQTRNHLGGKSVGAFKYDFTGNVLQEYESHQTSASQTPDVMTRSYTYDHGNRMVGSTSKLNSTTASMSYTYYAFGQLASKRYGSTAVVESRFYNIRGWLKSLSSSKLNMTLDYSGRYGGDITRIDWQHLGASTSHPARSYSFTYTPLGQYKSAGTTATNYSETGFVYDKMGNATAFRRNGATAAAIDNMTLAYTGNRLTTLTNNGTSYTYAYDVNGNTTKDGLRALNLEYNFLNLVGKVKDASNTTLATYRWLPDGTKLGVSTPANTGFEYLGSLIYTRTGANAYTLESAPFDGGRIIAGSSYVTQYFVTDHLGSTRVAFDKDGKDQDRSDYYPTGERWADPALPATTNRWQYNGKERQTTGMPTTHSTYLDYGARMYDSKIGRWHTIDLMAEKYYPVGPYVYCLNNPIRFIDPDGRDVAITGSLSEDALKQLQSSLKKITLSMNDSGEVSYTAIEGAKLRGNDKQMAAMINDHSVNVNLVTTDKMTASTGDMMVGGAFMGNTVTTDADGNTTVSAFQEVNPNILGSIDEYTGTPGKMMMHEATEAYYGAKISQKAGVGVGPAGRDDVKDPLSVFNRAHNRATPQTPVYETIYDVNGKKLQLLPDGKYPDNVSRAEWSITDRYGKPQVIQKKY